MPPPGGSLTVMAQRGVQKDIHFIQGKDEYIAFQLYDRTTGEIITDLNGYTFNSRFKETHASPATMLHLPDGEWERMEDGTVVAHVPGETTARYKGRGVYDIEGVTPAGDTFEVRYGTWDVKGEVSGE